MMEAVYNASGLGLPIVMTVGNRAIGAPINIWNDWSDSMAARDAAWIQLFVEDNQQALDVHIQAFRLAEAVSLPVMVCMDGFILTHAYTRVDVPEPEAVAEALPTKTALLVHLDDKPGALARFLTVLADADIDLAWLQSRPVPGSPGQYGFLLDFHGRPDDPVVAEALSQARIHCHVMKILGTRVTRDGSDFRRVQKR